MGRDFIDYQDLDDLDEDDGEEIDLATVGSSAEVSDEKDSLTDVGMGSARRESHGRGLREICSLMLLKIGKSSLAVWRTVLSNRKKCVQIGRSLARAIVTLMKVNGGIIKGRFGSIA